MTAAQRRLLRRLARGWRLVLEAAADADRRALQLDMLPPAPPPPAPDLAECRRVAMYTPEGVVMRPRYHTIDALREAGMIAKANGMAGERGTILQFTLTEAGEERATRLLRRKNASAA